jgi:anti-sigma factor RsiW
MLYLDSEGEPALHVQIQDHLGTCPDCSSWFARQQRFERALREGLETGPATVALWSRVLAGAGLARQPRRRRRLLAGAVVAAAAVLALAVGLAFYALRQPSSPELATLAAIWHERLIDGQVKPEFLSSSDEAVDRWLKFRVPFRVHCPPRTDVNFAVRGAGVCSLKGNQEAAYIVGQVENRPVSILVMDRSSLLSFPHESARLRDGRHFHDGEGQYQMVSGIVADNLVVVVGSAPADKLEKLLDAYGTYPD